MQSPTPMNPNAPKFEPPPRIAAAVGDRRGGSATFRDAPRGGRDSGPLLGSLGRAETHAAAGRPSRAPVELSRSGGRAGEDDGLGDRWQGGGGGGRSGRAKRGRSDSPPDDRDLRDRDYPSSKRARTEPQRSPPQERSRRSRR